VNSRIWLSDVDDSIINMVLCIIIIIIIIIVIITAGDLAVPTIFRHE